MSFWKSDIIAVNGFEEEIEGWGGEDTELTVRFTNNGIQRLNITGMATCVHLYHPGDANSSVTRKRNGAIEDEAIRTNKKRANKGIDQYL